jgi:hypothetical protein
VVMEFDEHFRERFRQLLICRRDVRRLGRLLCPMVCWKNYSALSVWRPPLDRGLRTFDTAVLIDGMRFRGVAATQGDASSFLTDPLVVDTAGIEVLRGAGSSLYGANAVQDVVNIVTDPSGRVFHGDLTAG